MEDRTYRKSKSRVERPVRANEFCTGLEVGVIRLSSVLGDSCFRRNEVHEAWINIIKVTHSFLIPDLIRDLLDTEGDSCFRRNEVQGVWEIPAFAGMRNVGACMKKRG